MFFVCILLLAYYGGSSFVTQHDNMYIYKCVRCLQRTATGCPTQIIKFGDCSEVVKLTKHDHTMYCFVRYKYIGTNRLVLFDNTTSGNSGLGRPSVARITLIHHVHHKRRKHELKTGTSSKSCRNSSITPNGKNFTSAELE